MALPPPAPGDLQSPPALPAERLSQAKPHLLTGATASAGPADTCPFPAEARRGGQPTRGAGTSPLSAATRGQLPERAPPGSREPAGSVGLGRPGSCPPPPGKAAGGREGTGASQTHAGRGAAVHKGGPMPAARC